MNEVYVLSCLWTNAYGEKQMIVRGVFRSRKRAMEEADTLTETTVPHQWIVDGNDRWFWGFKSDLPINAPMFVVDRMMIREE